MINGYSLLKVDHPSNSKRGGVCLSFKEHLPLITRNYLSILQERLVTEIILDIEKCCLTCSYRSPNQNHEESKNFSTNLDLLLSNVNENHSTCSIFMGNFNAKCSKWWESDKNNKTGIGLDIITTKSGYCQLIN